MRTTDKHPDVISWTGSAKADQASNAAENDWFGAALAEVAMELDGVQDVLVGAPGERLGPQHPPTKSQTGKVFAQLGWPTASGGWDYDQDLVAKSSNMTGGFPSNLWVHSPMLSGRGELTGWAFGQ